MSENNQHIEAGLAEEIINSNLQVMASVVAALKGINLSAPESDVVTAVANALAGKVAIEAGLAEEIINSN